MVKQKRTEVQERVERIITDVMGDAVSKRHHVIEQIMEVVDEIVEDLEARGEDDEDTRSLDELLEERYWPTALADPENVDLHEVDE